MNNSNFLRFALAAVIVVAGFVAFGQYAQPSAFGQSGTGGTGGTGPIPTEVPTPVPPTPTLVPATPTPTVVVPTPTPVPPTPTATPDPWVDVVVRLNTETGFVIFEDADIGEQIFDAWAGGWDAYVTNLMQGLVDDVLFTIDTELVPLHGYVFTLTQKLTEVQALIDDLAATGSLSEDVLALMTDGMATLSDEVLRLQGEVDQLRTLPPAPTPVVIYVSPEPGTGEGTDIEVCNGCQIGG